MSLKSKLFCNHEEMIAILNDGKVIKKGDCGDAVARLRAALVELGYLIPIPIENEAQASEKVFDTETNSALLQFQRQEGLTVSGELDMATLCHIDLLLWRETGNLSETLDERDLPAM